MPITLVYDGGCPFCRSFALQSELKGGLPGLNIRDGRTDHALRQELAQRGYHLRDGAMLLDGERIWHGSAAIAELNRRMTPSTPLLQLLQQLFRSEQNARRLYPALLMARRIALAAQGMNVDPDHAGNRA